MKICSIDGCNNKAVCKGLCNKHYLRLTRGCKPRKSDFVPKDIFNDYTEHMAYSLGVMYSDGYIVKPKGNRQMQIGLKMNDLDCVSIVADYFNQTQFITTNQRKGGSKFYEFRFSSNDIADKLANIGLRHDKSMNQLVPKIPLSLMNHFIRGLLDGDGYIDTRHYLSYILVTGDLAYYIHNYLNNNGIVATMHKRDIDADWDLQSIDIPASNGNCAKFLNLIYKDATYYMKRKYDKYRFIIDNPKKSYDTRRGIHEYSDNLYSWVDDIV